MPNKSFLFLICTGICLVGLAGCTAQPDDGPAVLSEENAFTMSDSASELPQPSAESTVSHTAESHHFTNHLARESSPYLLLHAHNPVDWYPWGPEAFQRARDEQKPIFLSIGYSSCYWCHVMERLVFSDEGIAEHMNEHFISIKVDREERPDVDDIYMTALQVYFQLSGIPQGGGWPLSMFLTPSGKPFAGGTYFPPTDQGGHIGFPGVMQRVVELWTTRRDMVEKNSETIVAHVQQAMKAQVVTQLIALNRALVNNVVQALVNTYDPEFGGLDFNPSNPNAPKFPVPVKLALLQSESMRSGNSQLSPLLSHTLDRIAAGGIRDHLGGGFHRYSTDRQWLIPHFEKMLYDNAQLAEVYADAYRQTDDLAYRQVAEETFDFILRDMTGPDGGFYSALDAETDTIEGLYYVWPAQEIDAVLGSEDASFFKHVYGVADRPTFAHGNVLHLAVPVAKAAEEFQLAPDVARDRLTLVRRKLLALRYQRKPPLRDDKSLTSWNGLMIRSFAKAGSLLERADYVAAAKRAALFVLSRLRDERGRLLRTYRDGGAKLNAYLEDYAFLTEGLLALYDATHDEKWLNAARRLMDDQIRLFWDEQGKGFFFTSYDHEELLVRTKNAYDSVTPSGNSVSVRNLVRLADLTKESRYQDYARSTLELFSSQMKNAPLSMTYMTLALSDYLDDYSLGQSASEVALPAEESEQVIVPVANRQPDTARPSAAKPILIPFATTTPEKNARITAKAYLASDRLPAGSACRIAVIIDIASGWHINTNPARPAFLIPTTVTLKAKQKTKLTNVLYPKGHVFQIPGFDEPLHVYEKQVVILGELVLSTTASQSEPLEVQIRYQACNDRTCEPPKTVQLTGMVAIVPRGHPVRAINQRLFAPATSKRQPGAK